VDQLLPKVYKVLRYRQHILLVLKRRLLKVSCEVFFLMSLLMLTILFGLKKTLSVCNTCLLVIFNEIFGIFFEFNIFVDEEAFIVVLGDCAIIDEDVLFVDSLLWRRELVKA